MCPYDPSCRADSLLKKHFNYAWHQLIDIQSKWLLQNGVKKDQRIFKLKVFEFLALYLVNFAKKLGEAHFKVLEAHFVNLLNFVAFFLDVTWVVLTVMIDGERLDTGSTFFSHLAYLTVDILHLLLLLLRNAKIHQFFEAHVDEVIQPLN